MPQEQNRGHRTRWFGGNITPYILYLDTVWHPKDQDYSSRMPAAPTNLYSVGVTYAVEVYKNGLSPDYVIKTRYQKYFSLVQKEEVARLHETMYILPLFN